jgi:hypothetical protein
MSFLDYLFDEHERLVEIPGTPGYKAKMDYVEKLISAIPDDIDEQYKMFGYRRDWLIEFYAVDSRSVMRGLIPNFKDAVRSR